MFESVVSKISNTVRNVVCAVSAAFNQSPWIVPLAILVVLFLV
jgi:hypothetical protein